MVGLGSGCLFFPSIAVLPQYFEKNRSLVIETASTGTAINELLTH